MRQEGIPIYRRIKPISDKRRRDRKIYDIKRRDFLAANPWCAWGLRQKPPVRIRATQIHHMRGRAGSLYLNEKWWKAVSMEGHRWINDNPEAARRLGLLCQRGEWGKQT